MATYYKGFNKDMTCRDFQFEEGKTYKEPNADLCHSGFHACERPLDVFGYYPPASSVYHEVELDEVSDQREAQDSKVCAKKIKIGAGLDIHGLVKAHIEYTKAHTTTQYTDPTRATAGDSGAATSRGSVTVGANGVGLVRGTHVKIRGGLGAVLVVAVENDSNYDINAWKAFVVDGKNIKPDTWYTLKGKKVVEVAEDEPD